MAKQHTSQYMLNQSRTENDAKSFKYDGHFKSSSLRLFIVVLLVCIISSQMFGQTENDKKAQKALERGLLESKWARYDIAIDLFTEATEYKRNFPEAYYNRGISYYNLGKYEEALDDFNITITLRPKAGAAYFHRGMCYYQRESWSKARREFDYAYNLNKELDLTLLYSGISHSREGKDGLATDRLSQYIMRDTTNYIAYFELGQIYLKKGDYSDAIKYLTKSLNIEPNNPETLISRGMAKAGKQLFYAAILDFTEAISLDDDNVIAYYDRGLAYYNLNEWSDAFDDFNTVLTIDPDNVDATFMKAITLLQTDDKDEGCELLNRAKQLKHPRADAMLKKYCN